MATLPLQLRFQPIECEESFQRATTLTGIALMPLKKSLTMYFGSPASIDVTRSAAC
jgi:hypothetical protein